MLGHRSCLTHAVTLTMKQYRTIDTERGQTFQKLTVEDARANFRHFMNRLNRSMYGNGPKRLYVIPVLEGIETGKHLHYHCAFGNFREEKSHDEIVEAIRDAWQKTSFGNEQIDVQMMYGDDWLTYITKEVGMGNADNVDYGNAHVPDVRQK
ncbi:hypothetical protein DIE16_32035 [Burkholderia sp. Bp9090]|nr:hypothetical protein DIE16_32035 [Burkholderia sp. Bp9090]